MYECEEVEGVYVVRMNMKDDIDLPIDKDTYTLCHITRLSNVEESFLPHYHILEDLTLEDQM